MDNKIIIFGSGGHAKVVLELLEELNYDIIGFIDSYEKPGIEKYGYKVLGDESLLSLCLQKFNTTNVVIAVGDNNHRRDIFQKLYKLNADLTYPVIISPNSVISKRICIEQGSVIMDGVIVHAGCAIKQFAVINTAALLEHDCNIDSFVSIAPRASLGGGVKIGENSYIGVSSTIIQKRIIERNTVVAAGSVVTQDMPEQVLVAGVPAVIKKYKYSNPNLFA